MPGGEQLLGEPMQGGLGSTHAGVLPCSTVEPEVMPHLCALARHQGLSAAQASATTGNPRGHLGDVRERAVGAFAEEQALRSMLGHDAVLYGHPALIARTCISGLGPLSRLLNHAEAG